MKGSKDIDKRISLPYLSHEEFRQAAYKAIDLIVAYRMSLRQQEYVSTDVSPGECATKFKSYPPFKGITFDKLLKEFVHKILPGVVHWQHPRFFGYFPAGASYASILGTLLSQSISIMGFDWSTCPVSTELEIVVTQWLAKAIGLPEKFIASESNHDSISYILPNQSEAVLIAMYAARKEHENIGHDISKLVVYSSKLAHGNIKKAANMLGVQHREVNPYEITVFDNNYQYDIDGANSEHVSNASWLYQYGIKRIDVEKEIEKDVENGLIPFFIVCTLGTTDICSFDQLYGMDTLSNKYNVWLHVDASYAGAAFICPELRYDLLSGIEHFHSFTMNPYKWMLMGYDGCCFWSSKRSSIRDAMSVIAAYLIVANNSIEASSLRDHLWKIDLREYSLATSRGFYALKLWTLIQLYGIAGIQHHIRKHVKLATLMTKLVQSDKRIRLINTPRLGLVCFSLASHTSAEQTFNFIDRINSTKTVFLNGSLLCKRMCVIRVCICSEDVEEIDIQYLWRQIKEELNKDK